MPSSNEETALVGKVNKGSDNAKARVNAMFANVKNGNPSIRLLAIIGGAALIVDAASGIYENCHVIGLQHFLNALIEFYAMVFGIAAVVMESDKEAIPYTNKVRYYLGENLGMVRTVTGRGIFYFVGGTLVISVDSADTRSRAIGLLVMIIGIIYIIVGKIAADKGKRERTIKRKFNAIAGDSDIVELADFHSLLQKLDIDVNLREAEMIFVSMDKNLDLGISFEEFKTFWETNDDLPPVEYIIKIYNMNTMIPSRYQNVKKR